MNVAFQRSVAFFPWWGLAKIEIKVHLSLTEAETWAKLSNRVFNHQPDQFSLKVLSYQVKSLLSWMNGWVGW